MKGKVFSKGLSLILVLSLVLSCIAFSFSTVGAATVEPKEVSASTKDASDFSWDNATVYFLLTDRFKNGNTSNDHAYNRGLDENGNVVTGIDTRGTFHGGDFAGITQAINEGYFNDLGVNALWISAPYEQLHGYVIGDDSSPSFAHYSYHGYYVLDYTQTDANFGTAEEFETLVDTAHEHGLRVIMDIVMNHSAYNSVYDMVEYGYGTVKSGWESSYYSHENSNKIYHSFIDYDNNADDWAKWWGADWIRCGVAGYTPGGGDDITRSLAGLPDFKTESTATVGIPEVLKTKWTKEGRLAQETNEMNAYFSKTGKAKTVRNILSYWLSSWVREYGVDGFRCDTAKHVEFASWKELKDTCVDALKEWRANNPTKAGADWDEDFWMTGEAWDHGVSKDGYYTEGGFDSMINFSTQGGGLVAQGTVKNTYNGFANAINNDDSFNVLSYISSHDSVLARGDMIKTGSAFLLLPGAVQIFYGDETNRPMVPGMSFDGNGGAGHSLRSDMNWDSIDAAVLDHWQKVGTFRNNHIAVGAGANEDLTSTSGYAFSRTYSKNGISDKIAGCIYAGSNKDVTIDVSTLWEDGQGLVNAYDQSSAVVQNGKVTFNSGANGTILIQVPDGRPLLNVKGKANFSGTQTLTVSLEECDSAKCSIDGGNKFIVKNGDTFEIGNTAYEGNAIKVTLEAENEKGASTATFTFTKVKPGTGDIDPTDPTIEKKQGKLVVKTADGSAPYAYVWTGSDTAICGAWPGTRLSEKDESGNYVLNLDTTETYHVVLNNGSDAKKTKDLKNLYGTSVIELSSSYSATVKSTEGQGSGTPSTGESVIIRVKPFDDSDLYLYVWDDTTQYNGGFPGRKLTEKDENGNYIFIADGASTVSAVVSKGSNQNQTSNITGLSGDCTIIITNAACTENKVEKVEVPLSGMPLLIQEAREVKAMTASDYTSQSWSKVNSLMTAVDALIALGADAPEEEITAKTEELKAAKAALVLAYPSLSYAVKGQSIVKGVSVPDASVTVTAGSVTKTVKADDVTGEFTVTGLTINASTTVSVKAERKGLSSQTFSYKMSNGDIVSTITPTEPPTQPTTKPATQPTTKPTTQPTTQPTTKPTTKPTTPASETLKVNAVSNVFPSSSMTFNKDEGTVTVTYKLTANMGVVNTEWVLTYDPAKLGFTYENNRNNGKQTICPAAGKSLVFNKPSEGVIKGNFSNINMFDFTKGGDFVSITFNILGTGETEVNLNLDFIGLGYKDSSDKLMIGYIVDNGAKQDISGKKGFEKAAITLETEFVNGCLLGDVNLDGSIDVSDATDILYFVVEKKFFNAKQLMAAEFDGDGVITVKDATAIQEYVAGIR